MTELQRRRQLARLDRTDLIDHIIRLERDANDQDQA